MSRLANTGCLMVTQLSVVPGMSDHGTRSPEHITRNDCGAQIPVLTGSTSWFPGDRRVSSGKSCSLFRIML